MRLWMLVLAAVCLIGVCMAEPKPVDGDWHRSDEVPVETPADAPPDDATEQAEPEAADGDVRRVYDVIPNGVTICCGLFALAAAGWWLLTRRSRR